MKSNIIIGVIFTALLSGCTSVNFTKSFQTYEFSSEDSYIGMFVDGAFDIGLKNLDTSEKYNFSVKNNKKQKLRVLKVPEGDYAISYITKKMGFLDSASLKMPVPLVMKTLITVKNNKLTYIGNLSSTVKSGYNSSTHYLNFAYTMDDFINEIKDNYYYSDNFDVTSIDYLTIATKEESSFKF